jgi:hypothetical protein
VDEISILFNARFGVANSNTHVDAPERSLDRLGEQPLNSMEGWRSAPDAPKANSRASLAPRREV